MSQGHASYWVLVHEDVVVGTELAAVDTPWGMLDKEHSSAVVAGTLLVAIVHSWGFSLKQGIGDDYFAVSLSCW